MGKQKIVVKVSMNTDKKTRKALKIAVSITGVESASFVGPDKDQIAVTGAGIDSVELTTLLRKKVGYTELLSVGPVEEKKPEADKPKPPEPTFFPFPFNYHDYGYGYGTPADIANIGGVKSMGLLRIYQYQPPPSAWAITTIDTGSMDGPGPAEQEVVEHGSVDRRIHVPSILLNLRGVDIKPEAVYIRT
ncbi:hypothetical protein R6Q57_008473 [Mikania cordata]